MHSTYAQTQKTAQKKEASTAAAVLDASSQNEGLQRKADMANGAAQREEAPRPNNTGMPDNLKSGIESLSGFSMDDVRVHYNSSKPATVQALAYTQGTDIHVAPGQEKHLPHEAWHVAQQMAGRVSPTTNINGMPVNDNEELEHEADVMGEKAAQRMGIARTKNNFLKQAPCCQLIRFRQKEARTRNIISDRNFVFLGELVHFFSSERKDGGQDIRLWNVVESERCEKKLTIDEQRQFNEIKDWVKTKEDLAFMSIGDIHSFPALYKKCKTMYEFPEKSELDTSDVKYEIAVECPEELKTPAIRLFETAINNGDLTRLTLIRSKHTQIKNESGTPLVCHYDKQKNNLIIKVYSDVLTGADVNPSVMRAIYIIDGTNLVFKEIVPGH